MSKIEIVTAFFDIGREHSPVYARTVGQYFDYFKFWARLRNHLTVYCTPDDKERVLQIRREYGLEDKTTIISIDDVYSIEPKIYKQMCRIEKDGLFQSFRYFDIELSNTAKYDYIVLLKWWFVADAAKRAGDECFLAWVDFGYNHGDKKYTNSQDFDFEWDYDFPDKINAFCLHGNDPDKMSLIDSLQFQKDCFIGSPIIIPKKMTEWYWKQVRSSMEALISVGCIDDDQHLQLMVYKQYAEKYSIIHCDWFDAFEICSNQHFTVREKKNVQPYNCSKDKKVSFLRRVRRKIGWCYRRISDPNYPRVYENPFITRMKEKVRSYYG